MLKLFGAGGADHPMRNPKEAKRILDALPPDDLKSLDELAHWHESVSASRNAATFSLDQSGNAESIESTPRARAQCTRSTVPTRPTWQRHPLACAYANHVGVVDRFHESVLPTKASSRWQEWPVSAATSR